MADDIKNCRDLEEHLAPYVDGEETSAARRAVEAHLAACPPCHDHAVAERAARDFVAERRAGLRVAAPDALRARCASLSASAAPSALAASAFAEASASAKASADKPAGQAGTGRSRMATMRRWVPLSLAASLVLAVAGVFVFGLNDRVEALAASLAVDHMKCFKLPGNDSHGEPAVAERAWQQDQGWPIVVPPSEPSLQLKLVDVRRCFSSDGRAAHMMYTCRGVALSVYVSQEPDGNAGRDRVVDKLGHQAVIWCANRRTYAVVAAGLPQDLSRVVDYMKARVR
jgi:anti-sigma factor RsiW